MRVLLFVLFILEAVISAQLLKIMPSQFRADWRNRRCPIVEPPRDRRTCVGKVDTCWSPGVRDLDCPNSGPCCFDGCANTCLANANPPPVTTPPPTRTTPDPWPCTPSPCGPGTTCTVNDEGLPVCQCKPGLIPKPDPITGCIVECNDNSDCRAGLICERHRCTKPECTLDTDCLGRSICQNQRCTRQLDPCDPSPCGAGAYCEERGGRAICVCNKGLLPNPDPFTLCSPECTIDTVDKDCPNGFICQNLMCVKNSDPCSPSPCGPLGECSVRGGLAHCICPRGFVGNPLSTEGCKPDPCDPSPCGPGAICQEENGGVSCKCKKGLLPNPDSITGCKPECTIDTVHTDCPDSFICQNLKCVKNPDACDNACGPGTSCTTRNDRAICACNPGRSGDPYSATGCRHDPCASLSCGPGAACELKYGIPVCRCHEGLSGNPSTSAGCKPDPCISSPCGPGASCEVSAGKAVCRCNKGLVGNPLSKSGCKSPCDPSPCGPGASCEVRNDRAVCACDKGLSGDPFSVTGCRYNPCQPSPCGPGAVCDVRNGQPICRCKEGLSGSPFSATGCSDPCNPSPCGIGAFCEVRNGRAICQCNKGLVPSPDPYVRCKPECTIDTVHIDCPHGFMCQNLKCVRKDTCDLNPCGPGAICEAHGHTGFSCKCPEHTIELPGGGCTKVECHVNTDCPADKKCDPVLHKCSNTCEVNPCGPGAVCLQVDGGLSVCRCEAGLVPNPDSITGCKQPNCTGQQCARTVDPCEPNPCGIGAFCREEQGRAVCECNKGLLPSPDPYVRCKPECTIDTVATDCPSDFVCQNLKCVKNPNPCDPFPCGPGAFCEIHRGRALCRCVKGFVGDPFVECNPDPCDPNPCGIGAFCENRNGRAICHCNKGLIPSPDPYVRCKPECTLDTVATDCPEGFMCQNLKCVKRPDPCDANPCGPGAVCEVKQGNQGFECKCPPRSVKVHDGGCKQVECAFNSDCPAHSICSPILFKCVTPPVTPCDLSPCGPGAFCQEENGAAKCICNEGLIPNPNSIVGCTKPECTRDSDCASGSFCKNLKCVRKIIDACDPNPCGPIAVCETSGLKGFTCTCPPRTIELPQGGCKHVECFVDADCPLHLSCIDHFCQDLCHLDACRAHDVCKVANHVPICGDLPRPESKLIIEPQPFMPYLRHMTMGARYTPNRGGYNRRNGRGGRTSENSDQSRLVAVIGAQYRTSREVDEKEDAQE